VSIKHLTPQKPKVMLELLLAALFQFNSIFGGVDTAANGDAGTTTTTTTTTTSADTGGSGWGEGQTNTTPPTNTYTGGSGWGEGQ
jgi:hypothetical protein